MNILFLSLENPIPPNGGHHIRTFNILKLLSEHNDIYFVALAGSAEELNYKDELKQYCKSVDIVVNHKNTSKLRLVLGIINNFFSPLPYVAQKYLSREIISKIEYLFENNKIDIIHFDMLPLAIYYDYLKNMPTILTNHNVESLRLYRWGKLEKNILKKVYLFYQAFKLKRFEQKMCPKFDRCIVVSEYDKEVLLSMYKEKIDNLSVIPNGVDIGYYMSQKQMPVKNHVLWIGGMRGPYSSDAVDYFLEEIFPLVKSEVPDASFIFIGKSPTNQLIKASNDYENVQALGFVDDIRPFLDSCSVFIAPIRSGSGTKIKVLNALAFAKPVVTTSIGAEGINLITGENCIIADSPVDFAESLIYLLRNSKVAKEMGVKGRTLIEQYYDWQVIGRDMDSLYRDVAEQSKREK